MCVCWGALLPWAAEAIDSFEGKGEVAALAGAGKCQVGSKATMKQ